MKSAGRISCDGCQFLMNQCVCRWIPTLTLPMRVIIIQDPKEAKHAKNTVSLLGLVLPVECISTQSQGLEAMLESLSQDRWGLVFPNEYSQPIEQFSEQGKERIEGVILIDATWRKAKRLFLSTPKLQAFSSWHFLSPPDEAYAIRKSPNKQALSTLEACAYTIEQVAQQNMQPLRDFMVVSQDHQWRQQPFEHKHN